jgi:hypothetical protein
LPACLTWPLASLTDDPVTEPPDRPWLTLSEAARHSGRHIGALRSLVRRRRIPARKGNHGQWLVQLPDVPMADPGAANGSAALEVMAGLLRRLREVEEQLADAHAELVHQVAAAARAEGEAKALRDALGDLSRRLDEASRPWWRRWLG